MGSNCCKGDAAGKPVVRSGSSVYSRSRAGAKLSERFTSSHNAGGVRLSITSAKTGDSGVYTLQASNAAGKDTTRVRVEVAPDEMPTGDDPPTFLRRLQDLTVKVGTRTRFLVEIVSSTECRVTWYRNDRRLMEAERIALVRDGNFWCADVSAVSVEDAGRWTCTAENIGGRASCSAHLNVLVPKAYKRPEFVEELRALLTEQGTVSLECKVVGVPTPVLRWFKDSREIKAGDVFALTANAEDPTSLGTYTCEAVNCMGRAYSSSKVQVVGRASREGSARPSTRGVIEPPPIFTKELEDQFVRICEPLTLSCQVVVPPWPRSVVWYNKEGKVEASDKYHIIEDGVGGYFIEIQTSEFADEGEWKCVATSAGGRVGISTCYVSMDVPKNYRKPRFMENLQAVLTEEGLVSFECKVVGFPTPVLSWFKDGQELKPGDVYQLTGTNSLGSYCCIAKNFMGQASSSAELTVEDIQNQLNEEEKLQLFSKNQAPKFLQGLKSVEAKIDEPFRFTIKVAIPPAPTVLWYRDEQPVDESSRCHLGNEERGVFFLDIQNLEFMDQAEWKCVAMNDYGQSVTSCFLKLVIPRHYKKPRFLENLQAILSDEGAVNLECKVIGVPQPVLKWYKDGEELKPGDIHRIISGQDGTCCLGTYTCEAQNCMGIAASSASLLGFEDSLKAKNKKQIDDQALQRNLSLSTIHEERTSQMYDTPVGDITLDDKGEISFSFDGKEVSVSLYETPDLTEEEALQIVEMYADQLSENITEHNVVELPPLRFVKETSTSGNLLMEAIIIDVSPEYFTSPEEDLRTEADIEDISIADENGPPQLSLDQDVSGEDYLEKTIALLSEECADIPKKIERKRSDSQKSADDYYSLSRDRSSSAEKKDDDTQILSESELQSFASAHSTEKPKSKSSKPSFEDGQESSDFTKTVLLKEELKGQLTENINAKRQREGHGSQGSRCSSEKSVGQESLEIEADKVKSEKIITENIKLNMLTMSSSLSKVMNVIQIIERDIILKSELMAVAATASRSLEIINSLITPLSEIHSITDTVTEIANESPEIISSLFNRLPQSLRMLEQSLTIVEKCIDFESENKTLVKKTCLLLIEKCGEDLDDLMNTVKSIDYEQCSLIDDICICNIKAASDNILKSLKASVDASAQDKILNEISDGKMQEDNLETKHLHHTQKVLYSLKNSLKSVLLIIEGSDTKTKNLADIKNSEIILDEISTPIQELQNSLEQIESLSVLESNSNFPNYNTEIIESVMNSVLKLRTAFEQLSIGKENKINEVLVDIKEYINDISSQIDLFDERNGKFDILNSDNKLEVLQTMAQILISLENSLPILDTVPTIKINMLEFHKNLTKVLENVIESNDSNKYFTLLEICNAVNRINTSLNNMESRQMLSLAVISNTLRIIKNSVHLTVFDTSLNKSVLKNINDLLLNIEETMNQIEETSINIEPEKVDELSIKQFEKDKLNIVLEHAQKSIVEISKVTSYESVGNLNITHVLENIRPILTEIQCCLASSNINTLQNPESVSDISLSSFTETIAHPLHELQQNISILNEIICENARNQENNQLTVFAEPLVHLQTSLEILQNDLISQYDELILSPDIIGSIANSVDNLQSCIVMIQEHDILEVVDDMSTLADISGIKTTADIILPIDECKTPKIEKVKIEEPSKILPSILQTFSGQALQTIQKHIVNLQSLDIEENLKKIFEGDEKSDFKSLILEIELVNSAIASIWHPIEMGVHRELPISPTQLGLLVRPLNNLQQSLSNVYRKDIPIYEKEITNYTNKFFDILFDLKDDLVNFLNVLQSAVETVDTAIETANKKVALRQISMKLENLLSERNDVLIDKPVKMEIINLHSEVNKALNSAYFDDIVAEKITEKVNRTLPKIEDEALNFTAHNLNVLSHEAKLVEIFSEIEQNVITLEHCDLNEESATLISNIDKHPQIANITKVDTLTQLDQITGDVVTTIYKELNESTEADLEVIEECFNTFMKELSILDYLIQNLTSPKKIIKSLQVLYVLYRTLNDFKSRYHNKITEEGIISLQVSLLNIEERLKNVQETLIQNISSQSELLFDIPFAKMKDGELFLKSILQSNSDLLLNETYSIILNVIESLKPFDGEWKSNVIEELSTFNTKKITADKNNVSEKYDLLFSFLEEQAKGSSEGPLKQVTEKIINVLQKHEDLKDILGVGSRIILTKCVAECLDILKKDFLERQEKESIEKCITVCNVPKDINIDELLLEISNPLESINTQIMNIRNKLLLASRNDIDITDLGTLKTQMNEIRKVNEEIKLCLSNENFLKETYDLILAVELNNKIGLIFNNLKYLENTPCFEIIKALVQPIEEIKQNLCQVISSSKNFIDKKSQNNKAKVEALLQQMEQHIEIIEIVEEVSAVLKLDDLKETASMVRELRDSIVETETASRSDEDKCCLISSDQIQLTDKLQKALTCLHSQALDCAQGSPCLKADICQQVIDVVSDLQEELVQLNNTSLENLPQSIRLETIEIETDQIIDEKSDKTVGNIQISDNIQSSSQVDQEAKCKYRTSYKDNSEDISPKESMIGMLLQNIQEYSRQDFSEICHEFASILNNEAIKISQEIAQQFCHYADLNDIFCTETKGSSTVSDEKQKIIFELYNNLQNVFTYEPAKLLGEIVVENKLLQFKNVIYSLCKAIENIQNLTITSNAESILSVGIPIDLEPNNILSTKQYEELHSSISETQTISYKTMEEPNERKNGTNSKLLETRQDSKSAQVLDKHKLHTSLNKSDTENEDHYDVTKENKAIIKPEGKLAACINEYISEEVKETLKNMPSSCKLEHLLKSYDVANQLLTLCMVTNFNNSNIRDVIEERLDLSIQLNEALIVIREEIFVHTNILQASVEQDAYQRARSVLNNLHDALQSIITVEQPVSFEHVMELDRALTNTDQLGIRANETEENAENLNLLNQIENQETNPSYQEDTDRITGQEINKCDDSLIDPINIEKDSLMISSDHENNISSIRMLEKLMQEINDYIDLSLTNVENSEMLQNNLDEVQSVIIKLKCDFDGTTNETLNETLEDLECNVRSVQLQINEQSAPALLKEACLNLQVIVASLNENELKPVEENALTSKINIIMDNCQDESDHTIKLLNEACIFENSIEFENIISCLDNIKDTMKSLRNNFLGSAETLIEKGIDVIQNLDQVEDKVFSLEKDLDKLVVIDHNIKDNITSAMHSVYATISNMRGAISGIQKKYMYENYGQPSQNFLKSIKNVVIISQLNLDNESSWKQCAKMFRKALNHFEDIKFYINFDRTARIPNDAAFTKIILQEIVSVLDEVQKLKAINSEVVKTIHDLSNYVAEKRMLIEERTTLEVKEKIPIFNDLSMKMLKTTEAIKILLQDLEIKQDNSQDQNILLQKKCEVQHIVELNLENADVFSIDEYKHYEDAVKDLIQDGNMLEASTNTVSVLFKDYEKNVDEQVEINREDPCDDPKKIITGDDQALETSVDYKDHENVDVEEIPLQGKTLIKEQTHYTKEKNNQITSQGVHSDLPDRENVGVAIAVDLENEKKIKFDKDQEKRDALTDKENVEISISVAEENVSLPDVISNHPNPENSVNLETVNKINLDSSDRQIEESLIGTANVTVLMSNTEEKTQSNLDATTYEKEDNNIVNINKDSQIKQSELLDMSGHATSDTNTTIKLVLENKQTDAVVTKELDLNEQFGTLEILEKTFQSGVLTNKNEIDIKESVDAGSNFAEVQTNLRNMQEASNIEIDIDTALVKDERRNSPSKDIRDEIQENLSLNKIDKDNSKMYDQLQKSDLLNENKHTDTLKIIKEDVDIDNHLFLCHVNSTMSEKDNNNENDNERDKEHENEIKTEEELIYEDNRNQIKIKEDDECKQSSKKIVGDNLNSYKNNNQNSNESDDVWNNNENSNSALILNELNDNVNKKEDVGENLSEDHLELNKETECVLAQVVLETSDIIYRDENRQIKVATVADSIIEHGSVITQALPNIVYLVEDKDEILKTKEEEMIVNTPNDIKERKEKNEQVNDQNLENNNNKIPKDEKEINEKVLSNDNIHDDLNISAEILSIESDLSKSTIEEIKLISSITDKLKPVASTSQEQYCEVPLPSNQENKANEKKEDVTPYPSNEQASVAKRNEIKIVNISNDIADNNEQNQSNKIEMCISMRSIKDENSELDKVMITEKSEIAQKDDFQESNMSKENSVNIPTKESDKKVMDMYKTLEEKKQKKMIPTSDILEDKNVELSVIPAHTEQASAKIDEDIQLIKTCINTIVETDAETIVCNKTKIETENCQEISRDNTEDLSKDNVNCKIDEELEKDGRLDLENKEAKEDLKYLDGNETQAKNNKNELNSLNKSNLSQEIRKQEENSVQAKHLESEQIIETNKKKEKNNKSGQPALLKDDDKDDVRDIVEEKQKILVDRKNTETGEQHILNESLATENKETFIFDQSVKQNKEIEGNTCKGNEEKQNKNLELVHEHEPEERSDKMKVVKLDTISVDDKVLTQNGTDSNSENKEVDATKNQTIIEKEYLVLLKETHIEPEEKAKDKVGVNTSDHIFKELLKENDIDEINENNKGLISDEEQTETVQCKKTEYETQTLLSKSNANTSTECSENIEPLIDKIETIRTASRDQDDKDATTQNTEDQLSEMFISTQNEEICTDNMIDNEKFVTEKALITNLKDGESVINDQQKMSSQKQDPAEESVKYDEIEIKHESSLIGIKSEENQERLDVNQFVLQKEKENDKLPVSKKMESEKEIEVKNSFEESNKKHVQEQEKVNKTLNKDDVKEDKVSENEETIKQDTISNNKTGTTSKNKQDEVAAFNIVENSSQINNDYNNVTEDNKMKFLNKNDDENDTSKKTDEVNTIHEQEKKKKVTKKKLKSDKKKLVEKRGNDNEKNVVLKKEDTNEKEEKLDIEKFQQETVGEKQNNVAGEPKDTLLADDEYKQTPTAKNLSNLSMQIEKCKQERVEEKNDYKKSYNYEGKVESVTEKHDPKESPLFIDYNKSDYSLDFPRPPNYTPKSYDTDEFVSPELNLTKNSTIYKAQTLIQDYQSRSSYQPNIDQSDNSSTGHSDTQRPLKRPRSSAVSESRSTVSEKRSARDLKRKPVFSTFLTDRTAVESSRVKLTCSILSSSDPTITWYKNGILLDNKHKFRSKCIDGLITLEVLNAVPSDSGEYSCTVDNENGSVTSTANLKVYPSFESSPIPPTFTRSIRDVYHSFENELVLECRIRGQPLPSITWYKDNKPIIVCERYQAHYLADGVCRLTINSPTKEDSGKYTCHAESSIWSDEISHNVLFSGKENSVSPNIVTLEKVHLSRQVVESRKPHFTNVISDYKVVSGGTIGLQVEIKGSPTRVEWLRDGCSVIDTYRNAQTYFDRGIYTLALSDVTERETGLYTCRAWSSHGNVDMNASITVVQANQIDGKPAVIVSRPAKDILISVGEDINISFRVQGEPKPKVFFMKGLRDITYSQRVCKMTSDDYIKFTMKRSVISDAGTYCILARNAYGCDRAFVTVMIRQRASSENLVSDWTYPMDDLAISAIDRNYKAVPDRIPSEPSVVDGGKNWVSLAWPKPDCQTRAPILAYKVESWLIGKEGGARWIELGITPRNSFDAFNLKQEEEYHFRITPRNRYGWGESVQTSTPIGIGLSGDRPEFIEILPGQLKVLVGETATLCCTYKGKPIPEIVWMKNGHDIEEDTNRLKITQSSYKTCLKIDNVKIEDEGRYSCEASNVHGRSSTYARMTVITDRNIWEADAKLKRERSAGLDGEYPPQFTMRLRDRRVQATYPVRLTCQVVGSPTPSIVWFKNAEEVTADDRHSMSQDEYFYTLEIAPTTLDDGGVYEAMARNNSGAISCRCSLVVDKGIRAYIAPEFCCGLEPLYQLREGEELRISAVVEAYPSVGVCWYRDGVRLRPSRRAIMTLDRDGQIELALAAVTARDAGVYTCTASNEVGRVSTSGKVEIISEENSFDNMNAPPIFVSDEASRALYSNEPRFLRKPRSSEAREGDTVIIECEVIGDPKPEVYWLRDFLKPDYYRDAKHFKRIGAGPEYRFEIPHAKLDYTGAYSVVARNVHGEAKAIISLQILARDPNSNQDAHNIRYGRVEEIPRFEKELTDLLCYDGDAIEFECRVSANPDPFIRWFHYTEVIPDCPDFETSYDCGTARLKIKQVTAEDEGTYKCEASNSLGKATSVACLVVYPPGEPNTLSQSLRRPPALLSAASTPRSTPRTTPRTTPRSTPARSLSATPDSRRLCSPSREIAPKFYTYPFNRVAEEGDTVVFQCAVKGLPQPWATWDKDGIIITASSRINIKEKEEMFRILEIEQVTIEDVGLYRITLENDYGRAEASARLEVISGKGKFHGTTRSFSASPSRRAVPFRRRTPSFSRLD